MILAAAAALVSAASISAADPQRAEDTCPLKEGTVLPEVTLTAAAGKAFDLREEAAQSPTLFVFFRGGWCPFCNLHLAELRKLQPELEQLGVRIVAISPDRPEVLAKAARTKQLGYTLLSDSDAVAMRAFGLAFRVDEATFRNLKASSMDLEAASGRTHHLLPVPAVFLAGTDGVIRFVYANPSYRERVPGAVVLAAARHLVEAKTRPTPGTRKSPAASTAAGQIQLDAATPPATRRPPSCSFHSQTGAPPPSRA